MLPANRSQRGLQHPRNQQLLFVSTASTFGAAMTVQRGQPYTREAIDTVPALPTHSPGFGILTDLAKIEQRVTAYGTPEAISQPLNICCEC